jgi:methyl-accepting chemotaxis protein
MQIRFFLHGLGILTLSTGIGVSFAVMRIASAGEIEGEIVERQAQVLRILIYAMSSSMILLGVISLVSTAVFVHRIAGPMVPLERVLDLMIRGDLSQRIRLRKHDEFQSLATKLNQLADAIESGRYEVKRAGTAAESGNASTGSI